MIYKSYSKFFFAVNLAFLALASYMYFTYEGNWYIAIIPFAIMTVAFLVFKDLIDRWGFRFQDVRLDDKVLKMIQTEYPIVAGYDIDQLRTFSRRMVYFLHGRESYLVLGETEKLDFYHTVLIATPGVIISMEGSEDLASDIERIAAYKHPFPSPKMQFLHAAEYDREDGVMIVSLEQLMQSLQNPSNYYHVSYHIWCERIIARKQGFPDVPAHFESKIGELFGITKTSIDQFMGYELTDMHTVALNAYFTRRERMEQLFPEMTKAIKQYLRM